MRQLDRLFLTLAHVAVLTSVAHADLVGTPAAPPALGHDQQAMLEANPDLAELSLAAPWLLRSGLSSLEHLPRDARGMSEFGGLGAYEIKLLGRNPALLDVWHASPEAAAELLALIKAADGKQGKGVEVP